MHYKEESRRRYQHCLHRLHMAAFSLIKTLVLKTGQHPAAVCNNILCNEAR